MNPLMKLAWKAVPRSIKDRLKEDLVRHFQAPSLELSLKNLYKLGFKPATIIDMGAYAGQWTLLAHEAFPEASILMLDAQAHKAPLLEQISRAHPQQIQHRIILLGPEARDNVPFNQCDVAPTGASVLAYREAATFKEVRLRMETLDRVLADAGIGKPDFLKLDTQGYELEILKGAPKALASAQAVLMEVSTISLYEGGPLFHDVLTFMQAHQYRVYDVCSIMRDPADDVLVQLDVLFVKADSFLFNKVIERL